MIYRTLALAAILGTPAMLAAETPNVEPGMWEYESEMTYEGDVPIPDQTDTVQECVTQEEIEQGDAFLDTDDMDGCEMTHSDIRSDGMDYTMECEEEGSSIVMEAEMEFMGDRTRGVITGDMDTPMGPVRMNIEMEGHRVGDC